MKKSFLFLSMSMMGFLAPLSAESSPSLERLIQGNQRYVDSTTVCHEEWSSKRMAVAKSQSPFAVIVTCSDSRVPPEIIFDEALGALFVVRVAGNIVDDFAIGSVEYGVSVLGANLVVVLGHSNCGAVDGALKGLTFDNHIQEVLTAIKPAVEMTKDQTADRLEKTIKANVHNVVKTLKGAKALGSTRVVGAYYNLGSGKVEFLPEVN